MVAPAAVHLRSLGPPSSVGSAMVLIASLEQEASWTWNWQQAGTIFLKPSLFLERRPWRRTSELSSSMRSPLPVRLLLNLLCTNGYRLTLVAALQISTYSIQALKVVKHWHKIALA